MADEDADPSTSSLWDGLIDLVVYAPIGLTLDAQDLAPDLARRGRQHTAAARRIGEFAVKAGMRRLDELVAAIDPSQSDTARPASSAPRPPGPELVGAEPAAAGVAATSAAPTGAPRDAESSTGDGADLAIPDYDLLAASQVVKRLDALDPDQLDAIRRHEEAGRGRRTILHKITRLQGE